MSTPSLTLYTNGTIITINPRREIILNGSILIEGSRIIAIGKTGSLYYHDKPISHFSLPANTTIVDLTGKVVIPGLINTHAHLAQSLLRGLAEDLPLHSWLCDAIWPLEASYKGDDGYIAAMLTIVEMLKSGTTCFLEAMLTHRSGWENVVRAVEETGIRACLGKLVKAQETNPQLNISDPRDKDLSNMSVSAALAAHASHHGAFNDCLHVWLATGTPRGSPFSSHSAIGAACRAHDIGLTMHCAEAARDLEIYRSQYSCSPLQFCQEAQLTSPKTVLAHVVHPDLSTDLDILRRTGTTVSHNPSSNCKLASGIAPIPEMLRAGVNVSLGTDGGPCNNSYDMIREMHLASILHSATHQTAGIVSAYDALCMATINGARALGLESEVGSLEVGKKVDFVVVDACGVGCAPWDVEQVAEGGVDPITALVHGCTGRDVERVVVDGVVRVENGELVGIDERGILEAARRAVRGIRDRSGVKARKIGETKYL
ncbi:5-methylthioadenosine/S-adenosylhomocysteine deaminase n1 [Lepidopterella palustris CBS 459.81]|uniref:5-methylthioadenosine/S-adenosylhomocysteine deaminase n1 n=1 Tax=Lepidopterella palustris CBS 459.81 TaxID=1314670 RepID=A0A8E2E1W3_9PEZI|nr:5-methylthioadenosine/S-adenosylhomocysteine deaminase n1 [Lepidopterella palustris CBS 459.81]